MKWKMSSVMLVARRWFKKSTGNTYHSVEIYLDGECKHKVPYAYGYNQQYEYTAFEWLEANGYCPGRDHGNGSLESPWRYCERMGIRYAHSVTDVKRKKDL